MKSDGRGQLPITTPPHQVSEFAWSAYYRLAFSSSRAGNFDIYTIGENGSDEVRLTSDSTNQSDPAWSPDGQRVAYFSHDGIHIVSDGAPDDHWVPNSNYLGFGLNWSPDGKWIAFANLENGDFDVVITTPEGERRNLTQSAGDDVDPIWEP